MEGRSSHSIPGAPAALKMGEDTQSHPQSIAQAAGSQHLGAGCETLFFSWAPLCVPLLEDRL